MEIQTDRIKKIKARKSYYEWMKTIKKIDKIGCDPVKVARLVYDLLESHKAFHYRTAAYYSQESLELAIKEYKDEDTRRKGTRES